MGKQWVAIFESRRRSAAQAACDRARALLSRRALTGPSATLIGTTLAMNVLRVGNTMILTRLLSPSDYGLVGIIMSVFFVIAMITDTGCQAFIIRHERGLEDGFLDAIWTVHVLRGVFNAALTVAVAVPLAGILGKQALAPLLAVSAISLAIDGAASLSLLTALRQNMVRRLSMVDMCASLVQIAVGLIAAWFLRNAWAIVIATIAQSAARAAASYLVFDKAGRRFVLDRPISMELWRFSRMIVASSVLTLIISQLDRLILARLFTLAQFGVYAIAASLAATPTALVSLYTSRIIYPALAEGWRTRPSEIRHLFYSLRGSLFFGYLFAAGGLIGCAPLLVRILYDPRYQGATQFLRLLAIGTAMMMLTRSMNEFMVAIGRVRTTLEANVVRLLWLVVAAAAGYAAMGVIGIVVALATIEAPAYVYTAFLMRRLGLYSLRCDLVAGGIAVAGAATGAAGSAAVLAWLPAS